MEALQAGPPVDEIPWGGSRGDGGVVDDDEPAAVPPAPFAWGADDAETTLVPHDREERGARGGGKDGNPRRGVVLWGHRRRAERCPGIAQTTQLRMGGLGAGRRRGDGPRGGCGGGGATRRGSRRRRRRRPSTRARGGQGYPRRSKRRGRGPASPGGGEGSGSTRRRS